DHEPPADRDGGAGGASGDLEWRGSAVSGRAATTTTIEGLYALSVGRTDMKAPPGWQWVPLTSVARLESGHTPSRRHPEYWGGDVPWVGIRDARLHHTRRILETLENVTEEGLANSAARWLPKDTVCLSRTASVGYVTVLGRPMATSQDFVNWVCSDAVEPEFLMRVFQAEKESLRERFGKGTTHTTVYFPEVKAFHVCLPPRDEQRRIVDKIDALTERSRRAKEALDAIPPLLERFRQSVLAAAFRGDLTADWRAKNPDVEHADKLLERIRAERRRRWEEDYLAGQRAKGKEPTNDKWKAKYVEPEPVDTEGLPELPDGWCWARLEELTPPEAPVVYGIVQPGPHVPGGVPYVRPADITEGRVDPHALLRTSAAIAGKHGRATLGVGDLVYSIVGTIGKHLIVDASLEGANITQSAVRIRPMAPLSAPQILWTLGCAPVQAQMKRLAFGNAVQRLNVAHMRELVVPVLPAAEWTVLEPLIEAADKCVAMQRGATVRSAEQLALLERAILAKAFRGALVPQDPNDDVQGIAEGTTRRARRRAP
ncbi:MAG: restriction endonuclease subunit S, partial [Myxococcales bacterium]|nr:restriction endonuclease subunit S [Myxococcales bacterium]